MSIGECTFPYLLKYAERERLSLRNSIDHVKKIVDLYAFWQLFLEDLLPSINIF